MCKFMYLTFLLSIAWSSNSICMIGKISRSDLNQKSPGAAKTKSYLHAKIEQLNRELLGKLIIIYKDDIAFEGPENCALRLISAHSNHPQKGAYFEAYMQAHKEREKAYLKLHTIKALLNKPMCLRSASEQRFMKKIRGHQKEIDGRHNEIVVSNRLPFQAGIAKTTSKYRRQNVLSF